MYRLIIGFAIIASIFSCKRESEVNPSPTLPDSKIEIMSGEELLQEFVYNVCELSPSETRLIRSDDAILLFSPGIFYPSESMFSREELEFHFVFHQIEVSTATVKLNDFWSYLQDNSDIEFNEEVYKRDFFMKIKKDGKIYQNWWNGSLLNDFQNISFDETNLKFKNVEFIRHDNFKDICFLNYSGIRMKGDIEGVLTTEDRQELMDISGHLDVFLHLPE